MALLSGRQQNQGNRINLLCLDGMFACIPAGHAIPTGNEGLIWTTIIQLIIFIFEFINFHLSNFTNFHPWPSVHPRRFFRGIPPTLLAIFIGTYLPSFARIVTLKINVQLWGCSMSESVCSHLIPCSFADELCCGSSSRLPTARGSGAHIALRLLLRCIASAGTSPQ